MVNLFQPRYDLTFRQTPMANAEPEIATGGTPGLFGFYKAVMRVYALVIPFALGFAFDPKLGERWPNVPLIALGLVTIAGGLGTICFFTGLLVPRITGEKQFLAQLGKFGGWLILWGFFMCPLAVLFQGLQGGWAAGAG
jgi:hypothetical protein